MLAQLAHDFLAFAMATAALRTAYCFGLAYVTGE